MKNSKQYAAKIQKLFRSLRKNHPEPVAPLYEEPVDAIVYGFLSENLSEEQAKKVLKRFEKHFFDWNDLRVSLSEEIAEFIGIDPKKSIQIASKMQKTLGDVFIRYNDISLKELLLLNKRPARQALEELNSITDFVLDYTTLTALQGHAIPVNDTMLEYLKENQLVYPSADKKDISGFLSRQVSAKDAYDFFYLLKIESESVPEKEEKPAAKKTTKKTTKKKTKKTVKKTEPKKKTVKKKTAKKTAKKVVKEKKK